MDATVLLQQHHGLIIHTARRFARYVGSNNVDEVVADAYYHFLSAVESFDEDKGKLSAWISRRITYGLREDYRRERKKTCHLEDVQVEKTSPSRERWEMMLLDMSAEARAVVRLLLNTPPEVQKRITATPGSIRNAVWFVVREEFQWSARQVKQVFEELAQVIG